MSGSSVASADRRFDDMPVGLEVVARYRITRSIYEHFLAAFADVSPIHVDADEARARGFIDCVMHGGILNGFLSHFIGMLLPGRRGLLLSANVQYVNPCYLGDRIRVSGKVTQRVETAHVAVVDVRFENEDRHTLAAKARVQVQVAA